MKQKYNKAHLSDYFCIYLSELKYGEFRLKFEQKSIHFNTCIAPVRWLKDLYTYYHFYKYY